MIFRPFRRFFEENEAGATNQAGEDEVGLVLEIEDKLDILCVTEVGVDAVDDLRGEVGRAVDVEIIDGLGRGGEEGFFGDRRGEVGDAVFGSQDVAVSGNWGGRDWAGGVEVEIGFGNGGF